MAKTAEQIDSEIAQLREEMSQVRGTETEIYTRIVGYYRPVKRWNAGKLEEYSKRQHFDANVSRIPSGSAPVSSSEQMRKSFRPEQKGANPVIAGFKPLEV